MLMRLSSVAAEQRQWGRAARLYERIVEKLREDKEANPFSLTMAQLEIGRLNFIERNYKRSADAFAAARDVLATPEKFDLNDGMVKLLVDKPEQTYGLMAESFFEAERYDEALAMFRKVDQAQKKPGLLAFQEARIAVRKKQPDAAIAALEKYFAAGLDEAGDEPYELFAEAVRLKHGPKQDANAKPDSNVKPDANTKPDSNAKPDAIGKPDPTSPEEKRVAEIVLQRLEQLAAKSPKNVPLLVTVARRQRDAGRLDDAAKTFRAAVNELKAAELWGELVETLRLKGAVEPVVDALADALAKGGTLPTLDGEKLEVAEKLVADKAFAAKLIESARKRPADDRRRAAALYVAALVAVKIE
ncbi:MAG TPA: hypothetical protein PLV92_07470, partial [Pirellulaceae bacterium]|nr:hypothetical protein [Pirellulaceae bacterium]